MPATYTIKRFDTQAALLEEMGEIHSDHDFTIEVGNGNTELECETCCETLTTKKATNDCQADPEAMQPDERPTYPPV